MHQHLIAGQAITREAVEAARVPGGGFLRDEGAIEVYVACVRCGDLVRSWVTPKMDVAPVRYCDYCEWVLDQEVIE